MPSKLNVYLLYAVMLAALLLSTLGAPVYNGTTDSQEDDFSGEEEEQSRPSDGIGNSNSWGILISETARQKKQFHDEFQHELKHDHLDRYTILQYHNTSLPTKCPKFNFSKEACFRRLAEGLHTYLVLLKHVEQEYPSSSFLSQIRNHIVVLISQIKAKMRDPALVKVPTSSQEEQLLKAVNSPAAFNRKMNAYSILHHLHDYLRDSRPNIREKEEEAR